MSANKWTSGPWYADSTGQIWRRPLSELYEFGGRVGGDKPVAFVNRGWWDEGSEGYPRNENARLIAAAPDLAEALDPEELEAIADEIGEEFKHSARAHSLRIIAKKQRAALAKARGEE